MKKCVIFPAMFTFDESVSAIIILTSRYSTLQKQRPTIFRDLSDDSHVLENLASRWNACQKTIWQPTIEAINKFNMIKDGDKVMVCLSGGKDSLCLLHTLLQYQNYVKNNGVLFSIGAVTVDPDSSGYDECLLIPHLKRLGVHYKIDSRKSDPGIEPGNCLFMKCVIKLLPSFLYPLIFFCL